MVTASAAVEDRWRTSLHASFDGLGTQRVGDSSLDGQLRSVGLGDVRVYEVAGTPQSVRRSATTARRSQLDQLKVCLQLQGRAVVEQDGTQVAIDPDELAVYDLERPYQLSFPDNWRCAVMTLPRAALDVPSATMAVLMRRAHPVTHGAGRLFASFMRDCLDPVAGAGLEGQGRLGQAGTALLAGALAGNGGLAADLGAATDGDAARRSIVDHIRGHLADPDLSPARIARVHAMSPRTLQRLFQYEPRTVTALIRDLRLAAVRADLEDPLLADRTIAGIGMRHGAVDQVWLSHAFREAYGISPSRYRAEALGR